MTEKRSRGRPLGTGKNDSTFLANIADLLIATPGLLPTTAMKRVAAVRKDWLAASPEAVIRRWQVKWKTEGLAALAAARERAAPKPPPRSYSASYGVAGTMDRLLEVQRIQSMIETQRKIIESYQYSGLALWDQARSVHDQMRVVGPTILDQAREIQKQIDVLRTVGPTVLDQAREIQRQIDAAMRTTAPTVLDQVLEVQRQIAALGIV